MALEILKLCLIWKLHWNKARALLDLFEIPFGPGSRTPTDLEYIYLIRTSPTKFLAFNIAFYLDAIPLHPDEQQGLQQWINESLDSPIQVSFYSTLAQGNINSLNYLQNVQR